MLIFMYFRQDGVKLQVSVKYLQLHSIRKPFFFQLQHLKHRFKKVPVTALKKSVAMLHKRLIAVDHKFSTTMLFYEGISVKYLLQGQGSMALHSLNYN